LSHFSKENTTKMLPLMCRAGRWLAQFTSSSTRCRLCLVKISLL